MSEKKKKKEYKQIFEEKKSRHFIPLEHYTL
jgi:hypothetical protein